MWPTRRPVKLQRSSPAFSLPARLSLVHLDTGGILAGWLASPLGLSPGHGSHLSLGHPDPLQTPGCFTAPQPDGSNALSDDDASVCTAAARMAPDSGSHWNRDFLTEQLGGWNGANLRTANRQFSLWTVATLVITN